MSDTEYESMQNPDNEISITMDSYGNSMDIVQGTIKEKVFAGNTNSQVNAPFQIYKIEDNTFSNVLELPIEIK